MPGPQKREWGFLVNDVWIQNEYYLKNVRKASLKNLMLITLFSLI
jgi:hypothetical protein